MYDLFFLTHFFWLRHCWAKKQKFGSEKEILNVSFYSYPTLLKCGLAVFPLEIIILEMGQNQQCHYKVVARVKKVSVEKNTSSHKLSFRYFSTNINQALCGNKPMRCRHNIRGWIEMPDKKAAVWIKLRF